MNSTEKDFGVFLLLYLFSSSFSLFWPMLKTQTIDGFVVSQIKVKTKEKYVRKENLRLSQPSSFIILIRTNGAACCTCCGRTVVRWDKVG